MRHSRISRRDILKLSALGAGSLLLPIARLGPSLADSQASSPNVPLFALPLPSPPVATPTPTPTWVMTPAGVRVPADFYQLTAKVGFEKILPDFPPTKIWGYNGRAPGPVFHVQRGKPVVVQLTNSLTTADTDGSIELGLSTHLHGGNVDGFSDGHPVNQVTPVNQAPRAFKVCTTTTTTTTTTSSNTNTNTKVYTYFNDQPAVTMWYHDHALDHTARNVYHGLASFYLLHDTHETNLGLPSGEFDVPLLIQSKFFNADGSLNFPPGDNPQTAPGEGILGDTILVNGAAWPFMNVQRRKYRFRFLNGSDAREFLLALSKPIPTGQPVLQLALSTGQPFLQIATEGGLLPRAVQQQTIHITPAERYEVIIDFSAYADGTDVVLQNLLESGKLGLVMLFHVRGLPVTDQSVTLDQLMTLPLMSTEPDPRLGGQSLQQRFDGLRQIANDLRAREQQGAPPPNQIAQFRQFRFERSGGGFVINGNFFDLCADIVPAPRAGTYEVWNLQNDSGGWFHPVHLHLLHAGFGFIVIDRNGVPITPADQEWGWKETVNVGRNNESVRVLMQWPDVPVNPANRQVGTVPGQPDYAFFERHYVFHCHNVDHEDHDMMAQLQVDPPTP